ncbi:MAG: xanthine dehydrogenase family protein molybdopterin-binding subunit [Candidatus Competibacteraceae bacterium]|nr:xanthine dehydrogenase family protein molybdopterin-binding subunit [Candidatus Competibacteraceae bacterium]MCB1805090.1 xanthine dehydrogenase family protein molybdopterin-binding subunit [Candidatus Competibacteraceae bacterium]MCB1810309.1 xanthine dehydrogenase family protein molybdopterin-binding subunit [Candidatus Competibacteraceae bacterium]
MPGDAAFHSIGKPLPRKEDRRLLMGQGQYLDDIEIPGALHVVFVRSPHAHARIRSIDSSAARQAPGVITVVTGQDLAQWTVPLRMAPPIEGLLPVEVTTLPIDKVRFNGDPVACVVAQNHYQAEDAAELVDVDYEPLPAVVDIDTALAEGAAKVDDSLPSNLVSRQTFSGGEPAERFAKAAYSIETEFHSHRQTHLPIETRGVVALWDDGRQHLTVYTGNQAPHPYRTALAARLKLAESQVSVIVPDTGGGFGQKIALLREELTVAALAIQLRRPVRWREDRLENLLSALHARENIARTRAAVTQEGRLLALELELLEDFGAYCFYPANYLARVIAMILTGPYRVRDYAFDVKVVLSNKCGNGPMRAPMAITTWIMEGTLDAIARELHLDPVAVRKINMLRTNELPYTMATGPVLEDVNPYETLERGLAEIDYEGFRTAQAQDRENGIYRGLGIASVVESTTYGSAFYKAAGIPGSGHECARVQIEPSGAVRASVGLMGTGQGYETTFAQTVAEGLGVNASQVSIELGNTDNAPYGMGSRGARGGTAGGGVAYLAALDLKAKVLAVAASLLSLNSARELRLSDGLVVRFVDGHWQAAGLSLQDIARTAYLDPLKLPAGMEPGLIVVKAYDPPALTFSNATHFCEVELNIHTGEIEIQRYLIVENCGTVVNPMIVEGQQLGATIMGLSGTLYEHMVYDEYGQNLTGTLADYMMMTADRAPHIEIIPMHTPNKHTPAGMKGMAEGGVMGAIAALGNAVNDALTPFGVVMQNHPLSPASIRAKLR